MGAEVTTGPSSCHCPQVQTHSQGVSHPLPWLFWDREQKLVLSEKLIPSPCPPIPLTSIPFPCPPIPLSSCSVVGCSGRSQALLGTAACQMFWLQLPAVLQLEIGREQQQRFLSWKRPGRDGICRERLRCFYQATLPLAMAPAKETCKNWDIISWAQKPQAESTCPRISFQSTWAIPPGAYGSLGAGAHRAPVAEVATRKAEGHNPCDRSLSLPCQILPCLFLALAAAVVKQRGPERLGLNGKRGSAPFPIPSGPRTQGHSSP